MAHGAATIGDVASYVRCCWRFNREAHVGGVHPSSRARSRTSEPADHRLGRQRSVLATDQRNPWRQRVMTTNGSGYPLTALSCPCRGRPPVGPVGLQSLTSAQSAMAVTNERLLASVARGP